VAKVEEYGVEPIPADLRTGRWLDLFAINFAFFLSPLMYVIGALAVVAGGLPLWWAVAALLIGQGLAFLALTFVAQQGVDYGVPGQVGLRATLGYWGSRTLSSAYRVVAAVYWFAAQAIAGALGLQALLEALTGDHISLVGLALGFAALQGVLAVVGFDMLRWVVKVILPFALMFVIVIVYLYVSTDNPKYQVSRVFDSPDQHFTWTGFATWITVTAVSAFTFVNAIADFARYTRSRRDMRVGLYSSAMLSVLVTTFVGAYAAVATGSLNPFVAAADLTSNTTLLVLLLVAIVLQTTAVNIANVYSVGLALLNMVPRLGRLRSTALAAAAGLALASVPDVVKNAEEYITHLGNVAAPLTGVIVADYLLVLRQRIEVDDLYDPDGRYRFIGGFNIAAFAAIAVAIVAYYVVPQDWLKSAWGFGIAAVVYLPLRALQARLLERPDALAPARGRT
jgi:NCS1 family nucleobase:cation symporter-1